MATVDKSTADELIASNGFYPGDPRISKIVRYTNQWDNECYAIVYPFEDQYRYEKSAHCTDVVTIWQA